MLSAEDYAMALRIDEQRKTSGPRGGHGAPELEGAAGGDSTDGNLIRAVYRPAADLRGKETHRFHRRPHCRGQRDTLPRCIVEHHVVLSTW